MRKTTHHLLSTSHCTRRIFAISGHINCSRSRCDVKQSNTVLTSFSAVDERTTDRKTTAARSMKSIGLGRPHGERQNGWFTSTAQGLMTSLPVPTKPEVAISGRIGRTTCSFTCGACPARHTNHPSPRYCPCPCGLFRSFC